MEHHRVVNMRMLLLDQAESVTHRWALASLTSTLAYLVYLSNSGLLHSKYLPVTNTLAYFGAVPTTKNQIF